jgi:hypothetical protein
MELNVESFQVTLNAEEKEYLLRVLDLKRKGDNVEMHHTDARAYREQIKQEIALIDGLISKLSKPG